MRQINVAEKMKTHFIYRNIVFKNHVVLAIYINILAVAS